MIAINKLWFLTIALLLAIVVPMQGGHCFDLLNLVEAKCCDSTDATQDASSSEESKDSFHECCHPTAATIFSAGIVLPLAFTDSAKSANLSFLGGMVKEIDYPPQLG